MMIDVDNRGGGKTTRLIFDAYHTGYPIVVSTMQRKKFIEETANQMRIPVEVFTVNDLKESPSCIHNDVLVDELEDVLNRALGVRVVKANMSRR